MWRRIIGVVGLLMLGVTFFLAMIWNQLNSPLPLPQKGMVFTIPSGLSAQQIAKRLHRAGALPDPASWIGYARYSGGAQKIKQGQYRLTPGITPIGLLELFISGKTIQYRFTLVSGWTFKQVMQALDRNPHIHHTLHPSDDAKLIQRLGGPSHMSPEGWFAPNTYFFTQGVSDVSILRRAYSAMRHYLNNQWKTHAPNSPLKTPYQALILASIVDRETALPVERGLVASVFINRLHKGMPLQSDPTVIYALDNRFKGNLTYKDLRDPSVYNTYVHRGLPPTPIAMPNLADIHAVLYPTHTRYLYFVATGKRGHVFSITYAEQKRAVQKYLLLSRAVP